MTMCLCGFVARSPPCVIYCCLRADRFPFRYTFAKFVEHYKCLMLKNGKHCLTFRCRPVSHYCAASAASAVSQGGSCHSARGTRERSAKRFWIAHTKTTAPSSLEGPWFCTAGHRTLHTPACLPIPYGSASTLCHAAPSAGQIHLYGVVLCSK